MKTTQTIFEDGDHKWTAIVRDPAKPEYIIDTNEYLVQHGGQALLLDPGGLEQAVVSYDAFGTLAAALAVYPSYAGPLVVKGGT